MDARKAILNRIRRHIGNQDHDEERIEEVKRRLAAPPIGVIPARAQGLLSGKTELFAKQAQQSGAIVTYISGIEDLPSVIAKQLQTCGVPTILRMGNHSKLTELHWSQAAIDICLGPATGSDLAGLTTAQAGVAETGSLLVCSGPENPVTINFLPEHHFVLVNTADIEGDIESALARLPHDQLSRTVHFITGPSRSGDIEQTIVLGAHGPKSLHILLADMDMDS